MTGRDLRHLSSVQPPSPAKGSGDGEASPATPRRLDLPPDNVASLADAREAADDGHRDALAEWTCALAARPAEVPSPGPEITHAEAAAAASSLLDASTALMAAAKALKLEGNLDIHRRINRLVNEVGDVGTELAGRWDS